jgi:hypothetical protein
MNNDDEGSGFGTFVMVMLVMGGIAYAWYSTKSLIAAPEDYVPPAGELTWGEALINSDDYQKLLQLREKTGL